VNFQAALAAGAVVVSLVAIPVASASAKRVAPQVTTACPPNLAEPGYCGDGGPVEKSKLSSPRDVSATRDGFLIADSANSVIRRVSKGRISTAAGTGLIGYEAPAKPQSIAGFALSDPRGVAALPDGSFAIADAGLQAVLLVSRTGLVRTLASHLDRPVDVAVRDADTLLVAESGAGRVFELHLDGTSLLLADNLDHPWQVAPDPNTGGVYVTEQREDGKGDLLRIAPDGSRRVILGPGAVGAAGVAGRISLTRASGVVARKEYVVVADQSIVRAVYPDGSVRVVAGQQPGSDAPSNGVAPSLAEGLTIDGKGRLLLADAGRDQIAIVPDVPDTIAEPKPDTSMRPEVAPLALASAPRTNIAARDAAPGSIVCPTRSRMVTAVRPRQNGGGKVTAYFPLKRKTLQISVALRRTGRDVWTIKRGARRDGTVRVTPPKQYRRRDVWVRLRYNGACTQSLSRF
jgi:glucose/arabinose dehydrogenase